MLRWQLQWGPHIATLKKRAQKGYDTPSWDNRPKAKQEYAWIFEGFLVLGRKRQCNGMAVNPLSMSDIVAYLDLAGVKDINVRLMFFELVSELDIEFLEWSRNEHNSRSDTEPQD